MWLIAIEVPFKESMGVLPSTTVILMQFSFSFIYEGSLGIYVKGLPVVSICPMQKEL